MGDDDLGLRRPARLVRNARPGLGHL
jgi:hypothetical protein